MNLRALTLAASVLAGVAFAAPAPDAPTVASASVEHPDATVHADASPASGTVADTVTLRIEARAKPGASVEWPASLVAGGDLDGLTIAAVRDLPTRIDAEGMMVETKEFDLEPFLPGDVKVGPLTFTVVRNGASDMLALGPVAIHIRPLLPEGAANDLSDPKGVVGAPATAHERLTPWVVGGAAAVAIGAALAAVAAARRFRADATLSPRQRALAALALLDDRVRGDAMVGKRPSNDEAYTEISSVLRRYIEDRFDYRATARTTEEFLRDAAARSGGLPDGAADRLRATLEACDEVKFGGAEPGMAAAARAIDEARSFVESLGDREEDAA